MRERLITYWSIDYSKAIHNVGELLRMVLQILSRLI